MTNQFQEKKQEEGEDGLKQPLAPIIFVKDGQQMATGYVDAIHGEEDKFSDYKPTVYECKVLAEHWVDQVVTIESTLSIGNTGSWEIRWLPYALSKLQALVDIGAVTAGELNHLLYVERILEGLNYAEWNSFGDGVIEHPNYWLFLREFTKGKQQNGQKISDYWQRFIAEEPTEREKGRILKMLQVDEERTGFAKSSIGRRVEW